MERRTQIAFVLIAVIMGIHFLVLERWGPKRTPTDLPDSLFAPIQVPPSPAAPETDPSDAQLPRFAPGVAAAQEILVRTPLYELGLSTAGGVITSLRLLEFDLASDGVVNLIPPNQTGPGRTALGVRLETPAGEIDFEKAPFAVDGLQATDVLEVGPGEQPRRLTLRCAGADGGALLKHFVFDPSTYAIGFELELERGGSLAEVNSYTLSWTRGMATTEANAGDDWAAFKALAHVNGELHKQGVGGFGGGKGAKEKSLSGNIDWASVQSKYFTVALLPAAQEGGTVRLLSHGQEHWMGLEITDPLAWRKRAREAYTLYAGPMDMRLLEEQGRGLEASIDLGWSIVRPIGRITMVFMNILYGIIPNYGVVILILSMLSQLLLWPLSMKSFGSMRKMQNLQPLVQELKRRYKDNPQELNRQMMSLWKKEGVNPMGGCMPMLLQIPVLYALYGVLRSSIELRGAPFVFWIDNLAAPDVLFRLPFTLPFLGREFYLLPLLMGAAMVWRSAISPAMPTASVSAQQQQLLMKWIMPIMMIFFFYKMPSGLVLYWTVNSLMGIWQQVVINRKFAPIGAVAVAASAEVAEQGSDDHDAARRNDGRQRGRGAGAGAGRVGGKAR